jgi:hypothetical protein
MFTFDCEQHTALLASTATQLQCPALQLNELHHIEAERGRTPKRNSKRFQGKKKNQDALNELCDAYLEFIVEVRGFRGFHYNRACCGFILL